MIKKRGIIISLVLYLCLNSAAYGAGLPEAKITIKVVDEEGQPMDGINASATFTVKGGKVNAVKGLTDANGLFTAQSPTAIWEPVGLSASKNGYYETIEPYTFHFDLKKRETSPWNPTVTLVLRKIENPVPMYARDTRESRVEIPLVGEAVGFDLIEYDWVVPYGKGKHKDFIFKLDKKFKDEYDFESTLTLTFPNKFDGIQLVKEDRRYGSALKLPRHAPENGYQKKLTRTIRRTPGKPLEMDFKEDNNYIFRIRSEEKDGKLKRAMYGKIHGDIVFDPRFKATASFGFKYYLNPDYTRNLEFDPKQNLFKNLKSTEEVGLE